MKMSSFLFLSMALHAAALAYPALRLESRNLSPVVVRVLDADGGSAGGSKGDGAAPEKKAARPARKAIPEKRQEKPVPKPERSAEMPTVISSPAISTEVNGAVAVAAGENNFAGALETASPSNGVAQGSGATGGIGTGTGAGRGVGSGNGQAPFVPVSYDSCPKPDYPESARRQGLEGTVTLRVLVDEQGKSKSLQVNRSSGFAVLDEAAVETVTKRCRFRPAYDGETRVESWIRIPVVFRLADLKN